MTPEEFDSHLASLIDQVHSALDEANRRRRPEIFADPDPDLAGRVRRLEEHRRSVKRDARRLLWMLYAMRYLLPDAPPSAWRAAIRFLERPHRNAGRA